MDASKNTLSAVLASLISCWLILEVSVPTDWRYTSWRARSIPTEELPAWRMPDCSSPTR